MTTLISREEIHTLIDSKAVTLIDTRRPSAFKEQHLPGAFHLMVNDIAERVPTLLPKRDALIVTYCADAGCGTSQYAADQLEKLGYTNVRQYPGGIDDWLAAGLPVESGWS